MKFTLALAIIAGGLLGLNALAIDAPRPGALLSAEELPRHWGAACPMKKCEKKTCPTDAQRSCNSIYNATCSAVSLQCIKHSSNDFEKCTGTTDEMKTCSETSQNGCITVKLGSQKAGGGCEGSCGGDAGSCGPVFYKCTPSDCE